MVLGRLRIFGRHSYGFGDIFRFFGDIFRVFGIF